MIFPAGQVIRFKGPGAQQRAEAFAREIGEHRCTIHGASVTLRRDVDLRTVENIRVLVAREKLLEGSAR